MKTVTSFIVILLVGLCRAGPTSDEDDDTNSFLITKAFYDEQIVTYTSEHNIVNLLLPINSLNFDESNSSESDSDSKFNEVASNTNLTLFFVEADENEQGNRIDKGLYVLKNGKAKKVLDNGRDAAASGDDSKLVFFGASDGIYVYKNNSVEKYGTVEDSIIGIAKEISGEVIYILTRDHEVYKVTEEGTKKELLDDIVKAKQIVLDYSNNIYFYSDDKVAYVKTAEGVKQIEGLPENPTSVNLIKPPFIIIDDGVPFVVDTIVYIIYANGSCKQAGFKFRDKELKPTAYAPEAGLIQYYAYGKKIYEYNILTILTPNEMDRFQTYLSKKSDQIRSLSNKIKHSVRA